MADTPNQPPILRFVRRTANASTPKRQTPGSVRFDLFSGYDCTIPAKEKSFVKTDIEIAVPNGCYGRIAPRSGLAKDHFIDIGAGVIDPDYRGNVGVVMFNFGEEDFKVKKGDRIAQLICERVFIPELQEVESLDATDRGDGGFGSTGTN